MKTVKCVTSLITLVRVWGMVTRVFVMARSLTFSMSNITYEYVCQAAPARTKDNGDSDTSAQKGPMTFFCPHVLLHCHAQQKLFQLLAALLQLYLLIAALLHFILLNVFTFIFKTIEKSALKYHPHML